MDWRFTPGFSGLKKFSGLQRSRRLTTTNHESDMTQDKESNLQRDTPTFLSSIGNIPDHESPQLSDIATLQSKVKFYTLT